MNQMEKNEFKERINGMDEEEKRLALQLFSNVVLCQDLVQIKMRGSAS